MAHSISPFLLDRRCIHKGRQEYKQPVSGARVIIGYGRAQVKRNTTVDWLNERGGESFLIFLHLFILFVCMLSGGPSAVHNQLRKANTKICLFFLYEENGVLIILIDATGSLASKIGSLPNGRTCLRVVAHCAAEEKCTEISHCLDKKQRNSVLSWVFRTALQCL